MRAVVQRVSEASVGVHGKSVGSIGHGLLVLLGVGNGDGPDDVDYMVRKICGLRVFEDEHGRMNLSLTDVGGALLVVSQFTLYGDCRKGRRPAFVNAMEPEGAEALVAVFVERARSVVERVETGIFRAQMAVSLVNDGPVTLIVDSDKAF